MMRKSTILALAFLCIMMAANAAELRTGALLGGLMTEIGSDPDIDDRNVYSFAGGFYVDYRAELFQEFGWGVQAELLYTNRGSKIPSSNTSPKERYELTYLQLPVMVRMDFRIGNIIPYLSAGTYGAYNLTAKHIYDGDTENLDNVEDFEFGVILGNGINWGRYSIDLRYEQALTPFYDEEVELKNIAYSVLLGYSF